MRLLKSVFSWIYHHFITFLVIVAVLVAGSTLKKEYGQYRATVVDLDNFQVASTTIQSLLDEKINQTVARVEELRVAADEKLKDRISSIGRDISNLKNDQCSNLAWLKSAEKCLVTHVGHNIQIELLAQERDYLQRLVDGRSALPKIRNCNEELEKLNQEYAHAHKRLEENENEQHRLEILYPNRHRVPGTDAYETYQQLKQEHPGLLEASQSARHKSEIQKTACEAIKFPKDVAFTVSKVEIDKAIKPLNDKIFELLKKRDANWWHKPLESIKAVLPTALGILIASILSPIAIKAFLYLMIAPLAARRSSNGLLPKTSGRLDDISAVDGPSKRCSISEVSQEISLTATDELLVRAEYVQITTHQGRNDTKWLLNWKYPLSSLVSGMYGLARFRPATAGTYVISSMEDALSEVAIISIPEGSAYVLHPHCLIGIVQQRDQPILITRHWRLISLHAWLTLQLRFLVFHGPAKLVVEGSHGVSIGQAGHGLSINQAATIGFGANLTYCTARTPTFVAYLRGQQDLLNDYFPDGPGYFIYEEKPRFGKRTSVVFGRGLEGIVDAILKVFGV